MKKQKHLDWISTVIVTCLLIVGLSNGATNCQAAEKYPSRPIQVLIGYRAGLARCSPQSVYGQDNQDSWPAGELCFQTRRNRHDRGFLCGQLKA